MEKNNEGEQVIIRAPYIPNLELEHLPRVEWCYPDGNDSIVCEDINSELETSNENYSQIDHVVDPATTTVIISVDGLAIEDKKVYPKFCKLLRYLSFLVMLCALVLFELIILKSIIFMKTKAPQTNENVSPTYTPILVQPSSLPSYIPHHAPLDNVTARIVAVSGEVAMIENSPQNKALQWLLQQDNTNQTYDDTRLIQRYALMVLYYGLSGEQWRNQGSIGTYKHECD